MRSANWSIRRYGSWRVTRWPWHVASSHLTRESVRWGPGTWCQASINHSPAIIWVLISAVLYVPYKIEYFYSVWIKHGIITCPLKCQCQLIHNVAQCSSEYAMCKIYFVYDNYLITCSNHITILIKYYSSSSLTWF